MFQTKVVEKIKTHILCSITFFRKSYGLWDNVGKICYSSAGHVRQYGACALHARYLKLQNTPSEYVTLISFPLQQWLHERSPMLRYTYIACLVSYTTTHFCAVSNKYTFTYITITQLRSTCVCKYQFIRNSWALDDRHAPLSASTLPVFVKHTPLNIHAYAAVVLS